MDNIIGKTFGRLTVIEKTNERYSDGSILYLCSCSCGCRNKEIKESIYLSNKDFVDGTNLGMIKPDRKLNSNKRTGVKGVSFIASKQKYRAQITIKGKLINLGEYDTLEEAKIAREKGEDEYFKPILGKEN